MYLLIVIYRNTRQRCNLCSMLTMKTPKRRRSGVFIVNFDHILYLFYFFYCWFWIGKCLLWRSFQTFAFSKSLWTNWLLEIKPFKSISFISYPSKQIHAQSQQQKHREKVLNIFKGYYKGCLFRYFGVITTALPYITRLPCVYSSDFTFYKYDTYFNGAKLKTLSNISYSECVTNCITHDGCTCINYNKSSALCELISDNNTVTKGVHPSYVEKEGWMAFSPVYMGRKVGPDESTNTAYIASIFCMSSYLIETLGVFVVLE